MSAELDPLSQKVQLVRIVREMPGMRVMTMMSLAASMRNFFHVLVLSHVDFVNYVGVFLRGILHRVATISRTVLVRKNHLHHQISDNPVS
jgi:NAD(P)H-nitrite reductase large subunit